MKLSSVLSLMILCACSDMKTDQDMITYDNHAWDELVDTDLSEWDTYLSYQLTAEYDGTQPKDERGEPIPPIGLNNPDYSVFTTFCRRWRTRYTK